MTTPPQDISVTVPVGQALDRVKTVLFQPFDVGKWLVIGFCGWLACLGEGGFHGGYNFGEHHHRGWHGAREGLAHARDYFLNNVAWLAPLIIGLAIVGLGIWLVVLWLSSRGKFMILHCVAMNVAEVHVPWHKYAVEANSLFWFRLVASLLGLMAILPLAGGLVLVVLGMVSQEAANLGGVLVALGLVVTMTIAGIVCWVIGRLTTDFIVPLQFLRRSGCLDAWRALRNMLGGNVTNLILYLLFRIVLGFMIGLGVVAVVLVTCCIAGCLFALPYLGTVFLLPILVFERSYSLHYMAQYGPNYDVFSPTYEDR